MNKKKKVAIIGANGLPAQYGGFETLTHHLTLKLKQDFDFIVYCSKTPKTKRLLTFNGAKLKYFPFKANGWQSVIYDTLSILHAYFHSDIFIVLGPNSAGFMLILNMFFRKKIISNYGGVEWKREMHSKNVQQFASFNCRVAAKYSNKIIADNNAIKEMMLKDFKIDNCEIIEYGGDHAAKRKINEIYLSKYPFLKHEYYFSMGRAQIDNNQQLLLKVFSKLPSLKFVIVSNWNHNEYGKSLKKKYRNYSNIYMIDAIYNQEEIDTLRSNCKLYIHSHSQCGTAPSLVEAMYLDVPIISFDVPTNRETTNNEALYFKDEQSLIKILLNTSEHELISIKKKMMHIAKNRYTWERIISLYKKLLVS